MFSYRPLKALGRSQCLGKKGCSKPGGESSVLAAKNWPKSLVDPQAALDSHPAESSAWTFPHPSSGGGTLMPPGLGGEVGSSFGFVPGGIWQSHGLWSGPGPMLRLLLAASLPLPMGRASQHFVPVQISISGETEAWKHLPGRLWQHSWTRACWGPGRGQGGGV